MEVSIRKATIHDAGEISSLATRTFYETYSWYNTEQDMLDYTENHFNPKQTEKEIEEQGTVFLLAFLNDELGGYAKMRTSENPPGLDAKKHIEVERIYVEQKYQRHKIGYALINKCIGHARDEKYDIIWLGVWQKNQKAIDFYKKVGFETFGTHIFTLGKDEQLDYLVKLEL